MGVYRVHGGYTGYRGVPPESPRIPFKRYYRRPPKSPKTPKMAKTPQKAENPPKWPKSAPGPPAGPRGTPGGPPGGPGGAPRGGPPGAPGGGFLGPPGDPFSPLRLGEFLCPCDQVSRTIRIAETCEETGDKETRSIATSDCRSLRESEARRVNPKEGGNDRVRGTIVTAIAARTHGGGSDSRHPPGVRLPGQTNEVRTQVELAEPELSDSLRRAP